MIRGTKLDLDGTGNKIKVFNANGDGNIGYRIYNIQKDDDPQNLVYVEVKFVVHSEEKYLNSLFLV